MKVGTLKKLSYLMMILSLVSMVLIWRFTDPNQGKFYNMVSVGFMMLGTMFLVQARIKEGRR